MPVALSGPREGERQAQPPLVLTKVGSGVSEQPDSDEPQEIFPKP